MRLFVSPTWSPDIGFSTSCSFPIGGTRPVQSFGEQCCRRASKWVSHRGARHQQHQHRLYDQEETWQETWLSLMWPGSICCMKQWYSGTAKSSRTCFGLGFQVVLHLTTVDNPSPPIRWPWDAMSMCRGYSHVNVQIHTTYYNIIQLISPAVSWLFVSAFLFFHSSTWPDASFQNASDLANSWVCLISLGNQDGLSQIMSRIVACVRKLGGHTTGRSVGSDLF